MAVFEDVEVICCPTREVSSGSEWSRGVVEEKHRLIRVLLEREMH